MPLPPRLLQARTARLLGASALATISALSDISGARADGTFPTDGTPATTSAPIDIEIVAPRGATGKGASLFGSGHDGHPGSTPDPISIDIAAPSMVGTGGATSVIDILLAGGAGGGGSEDGTLAEGTHAGSGGAGGDGSSLRFTAAAGTVFTSDRALATVLLQGLGGQGGDGGDGSTITASVSSGIGAAWQVPADTGALRALLITSAGGKGGKQPSSGRPFSNSGTRSGTGGDGGAVMAELHGSYSAPYWGATVQSIGGDGGDAPGTVSAGASATGITGGNGGAGGPLLVVSDASIETFLAGGSAIALDALGGNGAEGSAADSGGYSQGGHGGDGGSAGAVTTTIGGQLTSAGSGIVITAAGGAGGNGNSGGAFTSNGGSGGAGGDGGTISLVPSGAISAADIGIQAFSSGGDGGTGDHGNGVHGTGGNGGRGGAGNSVTIDTTNAGRMVTFDGHLVSIAGGAALSVSGADTGLWARSEGGDGGGGGTASGVSAASGIGGDGGLAGSATLNLDHATISAATTGIRVESVGGSGGDGGEADAGLSHAGHAGDGGAAGNVELFLDDTTILSYGFGLIARSLGGNGGDGQHADGLVSIGNTGGGGGSSAWTLVSLGSDVAITLGTDTDPGTDPGTDVTAAILAQSNGGTGGDGGYAGGLNGVAGDGAAGGAGGAVTVETNATLTTAGAYAFGILAQSIGGSGGDGNSAVGGILEVAGSGDQGGDGGTVDVYSGLDLSGGGSAADAPALTASAITTTADGAKGIVAQSIGGGGGAGGNAISGSVYADFSLGGSSGRGGDGEAVTVISGSTVTTDGDLAGGILAQSIGGGGGNGGNAIGGSVGVSLSIGGSGGAGGDGGAVTLANKGVVSTSGSHAAGLTAQSIGGGGGNGGLAISFAANAITGSGAIGGSGDTGGSGAPVTLSNQLAVLTTGANSDGVLAQSIGGGGGNGGSSLSAALALNPDPDLDTVALSVSIGGSGGDGGDQSDALVSAANDGLIGTAGNGSSGIRAQNIAGGGGNGGDAGAWSYAATLGAKSNTSVSTAVAVGGKGGKGGTGGDVSVTNTGLILTFGTSGYGISAQSIAGGGGNGGVGTAAAETGDPLDLIVQLEKGWAPVKSATADEEAATKKKEPTTVSVSLGIGGSGGGGGTAGDVSVENAGGIVSFGDNAHAIVAQSIAGGGGSGGAGNGTADADYSAAVAIGGSGGAGGTAGLAKVENSGVIVTMGANAYGILAQSVGGGGGAGGTTATAAGGSADPIGATNSLLTVIANTFGSTADSLQEAIEATEYASTALTIASTLTATKQTVQDKDYGIKNVNMSVGIGGAGGTGGTGGDATVTLKSGSSVTTWGTMSDAVFAQSVGGGGGVGGATTAATSSRSLTTAQLSVGGSGDGGDGGNGGAVTVTLEADAGVVTAGDGAFGIFAQSVGGGGGAGGTSGAANGSLAALAIAIGGDGGASGDGGAVTVTGGGSIATSGTDGTAIFAQSVGGGGGIARAYAIEVSTDDPDTDPDDASGDADASSTDSGTDTDSGSSSGSTAGTGGGATVAGPVFAIPVYIGGNGGSDGDGGAVSVDVTTAITTTGRTAYGLLAQSIGGGGGTFTGGKVTDDATLWGILKDGPSDGTSSNSSATGNGGTVSVTYGGTLVTSGAGATGIWVQSIGGSGLLAGDTAATAGNTATQSTQGGSGDGGTVTVTLANGHVATSGKGAHGIFAQSVGGGGGAVTTENLAFLGTAGGDGNGGDVTIALTKGSTVTVTGADAHAIWAQSDGDGSNPGTVSLDIDADSRVTGTTGTAAILLEGARTRLDVSGQVWGDIDIGTGEATIADGATVTLPSAITAGTVTNSGALRIGAVSNTSRDVTVTGNYASTETSTLVLDADFKNRSSDRLIVSGTAELAGTIELVPYSLAAGRVIEVVSAGALSVSGLHIQDPGAYLFSYWGGADGGRYLVSAHANFIDPAGAALTANELEVARHLQSIWNIGADQDTDFHEPFARMAGLVNGPASYTRTLDSLASHASGALGASLAATSQTFFGTMNSCPVFLPTEALTREQSCTWGRFLGGTSSLDSHNGTLGFDSSTVTMQVGGQKEISPGWFLGGSLAYQTTWLTGDQGTSKTSGQGLLAGLVLKRELGDWLLTGGVDFGYGWNEQARYVRFGSDLYTAESSPGSYSVGLHARVSRQFPFTWAYVKPYVDLHAVWSHLDGYTETGAGVFDLVVSPEDDLKLAVSPMLEVGARLRLDGDAVVRPFIAAGLTVNDDNGWGADARFRGSPAGVDDFRLESDLPDVVGRVNAGLDLTANDRLSLKLEYSGTFSDTYQSHTGMGKLKVLF